MSDSEPLRLRTHSTGSTQSSTAAQSGIAATSAFNRQELNAIFDLYSRKVARGEWRDYAIDFCRDKAVFSIFRTTCEFPLYRIEKNPRLSRKQGAFSVVAAGGLILKRGPDLKRVLGVLEDRLGLVST